MGRVNFYDGMRVRKEHLEHLQNTLNDAIQDIRVTIGMGRVCWGLNATLKDGNRINVSAGLAFDRGGNRIFVETPVVIPITFEAEQEVAYLYIRYKAIEKSIQDGIVTIISDSYELSLEPDALTEESDAVLLAIIRRSPAAEFTIDLSEVSYLVPSRHRHTGRYYPDTKGDWRFDGEELEAAPQPSPPAPLASGYDSGFVSIPNGDMKQFCHSLHSFNLLIQIQHRSKGQKPNNRGMGRDYWYELVDIDNLLLHNDISDKTTNEFRVMLWELEEQVESELEEEAVPDVTGLTRYMAEAILDSGGWQYTLEPASVDEPDAVIGRVLSQSPAGGTSVPKETIAINLRIALFDYTIETIEGIGEKFGSVFRSLDPPIDTLQKLSLLDKIAIKIRGVSDKRLGKWIDMATLMVSIEGLDGNAAEVLVNAGVNRPELLAERSDAKKFKVFYQKCLEVAKKLRLPKKYVTTYFTRRNLKTWIEMAQRIVGT
jgi:hypothetical protein